MKTLVEEWKPIEGFPIYQISSFGRVQNLDTNKLLVMLINQQGITYVGLTQDRQHTSRSVANLVANAFLSRDDVPDTFTTPIHLDGDKQNCTVQNLMWRPRWFAVKYHQQFREDYERLGFLVPIRDIRTGERFANSREAAEKYGLIEKEIYFAAVNHTFVWPTYQQFKVIIE